MNMLRIAVCEDDTLLIKVISSTIKKTFLQLNVNSQVSAFSKPSQLLANIKTDTYDLIFLDIGLPEIDGISLGMKLREQGINTPIIYLSAMDDKVYDCFEAKPFSFMRKSTFIDEISKVLKRFLKEYDNGSMRNYVLKLSNNLTVNLDLSKITYIESAIKQQKVYLYDRKEPVMLKCTLNQLEDALKDNGFLRSQRAYLVNSKYIQYIEYDKIYLTNGDIVPLGRTKADEFLEKYINIMA